VTALVPLPLLDENTKVIQFLLRELQNHLFSIHENLRFLLSPSVFICKHVSSVWLHLSESTEQRIRKSSGNVHVMRPGHCDLP